MIRVGGKTRLLKTGPPLLRHQGAAYSSRVSAR
jgi:hypothetical protein